MPGDAIRYWLMGMARRMVRRFPLLRRVRHLQWQASMRSDPTLYGVVPSGEADIDGRLPPRVRAVLSQLDRIAQAGRK